VVKEIIYEGDGDPHYGDVAPAPSKIVNLNPRPEGPIRVLGEREQGACEKCGAQADERFDCCEVKEK
jgi:hypothetical protein